MLSKQMQRVVAVSFLFVLSNINAADLDGKKLYVERACNTCHGPEGKTPLTPMYPKLFGQNEQYLINQMRDIKSGKRANGLSVTMKPLMTPVTEAEITAIAKYLAVVK